MRTNNERFCSLTSYAKQIHQRRSQKNKLNQGSETHNFVQQQENKQKTFGVSLKHLFSTIFLLQDLREKTRDYVISD